MISTYLCRLVADSATAFPQSTFEERFDEEEEVVRLIVVFIRFTFGDDFSAEAEVNGNFNAIFNGFPIDGEQHLI